MRPLLALSCSFASISSRSSSSRAYNLSNAVLVFEIGGLVIEPPELLPKEFPAVLVSFSSRRHDVFEVICNSES